MAATETGKERASRIPLDYFKKPDALQRPKLLLALIAFFLALSWVGAMQLRHDTQPYSRGPVAAVHATWNDKCEACHRSFTPLGSDNAAHLFLSKSDQDELLCTNCHAGPVHHADQLTERAPTCAACHREHQGRDTRLTQNADQECTVCHRELSKSRKGAGSGKEFENSITDFITGHPEFRSKQDPRKLKFNHKLHLTRGLISDSMKFSDIRDPKEQNRYMKLLGESDPNAAVQLNCAACHQLDTSPGSRSGGAYMQPIKFENHCVACHPLTVPGSDGNKIAVPHHLQPDEIRDYLWGTLAKNESRKRLEQSSSPSRPLPGAPLPADPENAIRRQLKEKTEEQMRFLGQDRAAVVEKWVLGGKTTCGECHEYEREKEVSFRIAPTKIPTVWLQHAYFDHTAHRAMDCLDCHKQTPNSAKLGTVPSTTANAQDPVSGLLLPEITTCKQCHAPNRGAGSAASGGARSDCVECHRYHNGDFPLEGIGAAVRDPKSKFSTPAQFHSGSPPP